MEHRDIEVIYEDTDMLAINKPAGLLVHPDPKKPKEYTLVNWLLEKYPDIKDVGEPMRDEQGTEIPRPGIVHRLDQDTTGVLLIAKTQEMYEHLKSQFKDREMQKTYLAFVYGNINRDEGIIDRPIGRSKNDFRKWTAMRGARGEMRDAITEYFVLGRGKGVTFVKVMPKTGRTHQIRVHFKSFNYPILGDTLYAPNQPVLFGFNRVALHAFRITFTDLTGAKRTIEAPIPQDFKEALTSSGISIDLQGI